MRARHLSSTGGAALALMIFCAACASESGGEVAAAKTAAVLGPVHEPAMSTRRISLDEVERQVASIDRISSFILFQDEEILLEHFANGSSRNRPINIKSASKSLLNALVAIAVQRGDLDLDAAISSYLPKYFERIPAHDPRREITVRHLLTLSSGLPSTSIYNYGAWVSSKDWIAYVLNQEPIATPGTRFSYSTGDTHLLATVLTRAIDMPLRRFAQQALFDPLGASVGGWDRDPQGFYFGGNNVALSPDALLEFGRMYLNGGVVDGRRVLSAEWIEQSWTPRFFNSSFNGRHDYGYLWWHAPFGGHSTWFAWGYGGQFLFVIPSLEAVVVFTGDPDARSRGGNEAVYDLMDRTIVPYLQQRASATSS